jgi:hypothetical protein
LKLFADRIELVNLIGGQKMVMLIKFFELVDEVSPA